MPGQIGILNVGAGDTKLTFDPTKPEEVAQSARVVADMIKRGFVLMIEVGKNEKGPIYQRAHAFDPATAEYIIAGSPSEAEEIRAHEQEPPIPSSRRRKTKAPGRRVAASSTNAVAVARTAGG